MVEKQEPWMDENYRVATSPKKGWESEAELAACVIRHLRSDGWNVWQEVGFPPYSQPSFDIMAELDGKLWGIETKLRFGHTVVSQAWARRQHVHWTSVASPPVTRRTAATDLAKWTATNFGIGRIVVYDQDLVVEESTPMMLRRPSRAWVDRMREHLAKTPQDYATAGTNTGGRWSPFRNTCDLIRDYVKAHPGATMKEVIDNTEHHYQTGSTARSSISHWARKGKVPGVRIEKEGRVLRLYPEATRS